MSATIGAPSAMPRLLLGATALAPLAWVVHILLLPALVPYACDRGGLWSLHVTTAALLAVALVGVASAHRARRRVGSDRASTEVDRDATFAKVGVMLSWLFAALIVAEHIPVFVIDACSR